MPDKVNVNNYSGKSNIVSLNTTNNPFQTKNELILNDRDQKLATLQKMADNNTYSRRFDHFTLNANNSIPQKPVSQLSKDNHSLPDNLKQGVESLSGISMDDVKVHYNSDKPAQLNAHAYAQGTDIHIASGQEKHLPHEAWHVVQQKQGRVQPTTMMKAKIPINDDQGLEKEADVMGARALQMKPFSLSDYKTEKLFQRKEIIQRFNYPENETPNKDVSRLIDIFEDKKTDTENTKPDLNFADVYPENEEVQDTENPMGEKTAEKDSPNKRLRAVGFELVFMSKILKKYKEKKAAEEEQERKIAEIEAALEATKTAKEAADRAAAKEAADRAAANEAEAKAADLKVKEHETLLLTKKAEEYEEKAKRKFHDKFEAAGADSTFGNIVELGALPGKSMENMIDGMEDGPKRKFLEDWIGEANIVGNIADFCETLSTYGKLMNSKKELSDMGLLGISAAKIVVGVVDTVNSHMESGFISEALSNSIGLLPGIKAGLSAFKNGIEGAQILYKRQALDKLIDFNVLEKKDKENLEKYKVAIDRKLMEISFDFILNAAEVITIVYPPAQIIISLLHGAINLFKFGAKKLISYWNNQERKRSERIGDMDIEKLNNEDILIKSETNGFNDAIKSLMHLESLKKEKPVDNTKIKQEEDELKIKLKDLNKDRLSKTPITESNLHTFLGLERLTILSIKKEVEDEKSYITQFYNIYGAPKKEKIIADLKAINGFKWDKLEVKELDKLRADQKDYFFNKTQIAIRTASNRKYISTSERLDMMEKILLTKYDNQGIMEFMLDKYENKGVYGDTDKPEDKFTKSVKQFKLDMKLD
jgi:hypothetical protein